VHLIIEPIFVFMKHNIYTLLHACLATVRFLHSWAGTLPTECIVTPYCKLGSVLAQMAFPLHACEISDKSETGREKHVSVPAESSHFFPFKSFLYRRGQNVTFFGKCDKKCNKLKKIFSCARASHSSQKCDKCDASHFLSPKKVTNVTSRTHISDWKLGRNLGKTDP